MARKQTTGVANWQNRTIWTGDNLDILRGMNSACVDLLYLDPPFNSNKNYAAPIGSEAAGAAFKDTWTLDDVDLAWHGEIAEQEPALCAVIDAAGLTHSKSMKSYLIMMAVRLLEMRRVLKPTGSTYLHCDPTAGAWLRCLMDAVFGIQRFRNEIVWQRYGSHNDSKRYGRVHDSILFYSAQGATWTTPTMPLDEESIKKNYRYEDERGRFTTAPLHARTLTGGGYEYTWHGISDVWKFPEKRLDELDNQGLIHWPERGRMPRRKVYLSESSGKPIPDVITDIPIAAGKERVGYPTQKPLALLRRIISASSNKGDLILDPFCGCATAPVAANELGRQWAGIDISPVAVKLVNLRLKKETGMFYDVHVRHDIPRRTDLGKLPPYRTQKHTLFGRQEGQCGGCGVAFPFRNFTIDHVIPRAKGGTDHLDNLQLLCAACNSVKGQGTQAELKAKLRAQGVIGRLG